LVIGRLNTTHADCQVRARSETDICKRVCPYPPSRHRHLRRLTSRLWGPSSRT
jgi:hypothetical protein